MSINHNERCPHGIPKAEGFVPCAFCQMADLKRQLAEKQAEIEAMRPTFDDLKFVYDRHGPVVQDSTTAIFVRCKCLKCRMYRDYESRKKPC